MKKFLKLFIGLVFVFSIFSCSNEPANIVLNDVFYTTQNPEDYDWDLSRLERVTNLKWGQEYYLVCSFLDPNLEVVELNEEYGLWGQRQTYELPINAMYTDATVCWKGCSWNKGGNDYETESLSFYLEDSQGRCSNTISYSISLSD